MRGPPSRLGGTLSGEPTPPGPACPQRGWPWGAQGLWAHGRAGTCSGSSRPSHAAGAPGTEARARRVASTALMPAKPTRQHTPAPETRLYGSVCAPWAAVTTTHRSGLSPTEVAKLPKGGLAVPWGPVPGPDGLEGREHVPATLRLDASSHQEGSRRSPIPGQTLCPARASPLPRPSRQHRPRWRPSRGRGRLVLSDGVLVGTFRFGH